MVRVLRVAVTAALVALAAHAAADGAASRHDMAMGIDIAYVDVSGFDSWTEGATGKLRYDSSGTKLAGAFVDYDVRLSDTLDATVVLEAYDDDLGNAVDVTEAFIEWRPVPRSATRFRVKAGAFYPRISLENVGRGWRSPYTQNWSTINTWVAEELRVFGAELSASRKLSSLGGLHEIGVNAAVFWRNDPAGSLLAWKGWSVHDRQTRFGDRLPLPPLPQTQPGGIFEKQDPYVAPFREIDGTEGYYVNLEWRYAQRWMVRAMHYDNRADPTAIDGGQYAWYTKFDHIGTQIMLPDDIGLIAQWMNGYSAMGPVVLGANLVDVEFSSYFLMLTKSVRSHRVSIRYDNFGMTQDDETPEDNNPEYGLSWTASYRYRFTDNYTLGLEWVNIQTHRCANTYYGLDQDMDETQVQLTLSVRF